MSRHYRDASTPYQRRLAAAALDIARIKNAEFLQQQASAPAAQPSTMTNPLVQRFERNPLGRDLIVGDIHGHFSKLALALEDVGFNPDVDRVFSVGDLVDRGPESMHAVDWLTNPWFKAVQGNHEDYAIRWPNGHMDVGNYAANGGAWNIANDAGTRRLIADQLAGLPIAIELQTANGLVGIVHAGCPLSSWPAFIAELESPDTPKVRRQHLIDMAMWSRDRADNLLEDEIHGVRAVVVGHTPVTESTSLGNTLFIDTKAWRGGAFTILDAATLQPATAPTLDLADDKPLACGFGSDIEQCESCQ